jgi:hydroxymethylbilane synthase
VTARLATHPDVAARAADVRDRLIVAGVDVEPITTSEPGADPVEGIRDRSLDLALVGVRALRGAAADGLTLLAVLLREDPRDVLIGVERDPTPLRALPAGSRVGVQGARRRAFLLAHRPDLVPVEIDEDIMQWLSAGRADVAVLESGLARRLRRAGRVGEVLDPRAWLPEPGQGTVALIARHPIAEVTALDHLPTRTALRAELAFLDALDAPPDAALGCLAQPSGRLVRLWAGMASPDGTRLVRSDLTAPLDEPELLGASVARQLRARASGVLVGTA